MFRPGQLSRQVALIVWKALCNLNARAATWAEGWRQLATPSLLHTFRVKTSCVRLHAFANAVLIRYQMYVALFFLDSRFYSYVKINYTVN